MLLLTQPQGWKTIKDFGYPPDGKWMVKLCPNGREHLAHVRCHQIQLPRQRWPIDMSLILSENDQWIELDDYKRRQCREGNENSKGSNEG